MNTTSLSLFRAIVGTIINDLKFVQLTVNLHDYQSLCDAVRAVQSMKTRYIEKFNEYASQSCHYEMTPIMRETYKKTLSAISDLITSLNLLQIQTSDCDQSRNSYSSSTSLFTTHRAQSDNNGLIKAEDLHGHQNVQMDIAIYPLSNV